MTSTQIKRVLLINIDSKIPNLALMKVSAYYKSLGCEVGFNIADPDLVYASVIFKHNRHKVDGLTFWYPDARIDIGGSGYDLRKCLDTKIESMQPDYSIYPECDYYLGFTSRGCIRHCPFCIVPIKEGRFKVVRHISEICHGEDFDKCVLMDNNILADKTHFFETADWLIKNDIDINFNQGLDTRLFDNEIVKKLSQLKAFNGFYIAFDNLNYTQYVKKALELMDDYGINIRSKVRCYVYCHGDEMYDDAVKRCRLLKEWGTVPFVMIDPTGNITRRVKNLRRWGTRAWLTMSIDIDDYTEVKQ